MSQLRRSKTTFRTHSQSLALLLAGAVTGAGTGAGSGAWAASSAHGSGQAQVKVLAEQWSQQAETLAGDAARQAFAALHGGDVPVTVDVQPGELDPRLKLAPCADVRVTPSTQQAPWGRTRVRIQCVSGPTRWSVYLPLTVRLLAPAVVARQALPAGTALRAEHLQIESTDWAESPSPVVTNTDALLGRTLGSPVQAGQAVRQSHLRPRVWFHAGQTLTVVVQGEGFAVSGTATALGQGLEDQPVRIRMDNGRVLMAQAVGPQRVSIRP